MMGNVACVSDTLTDKIESNEEGKQEKTGKSNMIHSIYVCFCVRVYIE